MTEIRTTLGHMFEKTHRKTGRHRKIDGRADGQTGNMYTQAKLTDTGKWYEEPTWRVPPVTPGKMLCSSCMPNPKDFFGRRRRKQHRAHRYKAVQRNSDALTD